MLREASLSDMVKRRISRQQCIFVARKRGNDELAPSDELFHDFDRRKRELEKDLGKGSIEAHNQAFLDCGYESRFRKQIVGSPESLKKLESICLRAKEENLFLVCYEGYSKACHRRVLLRIAEECFGAKVAVEGLEPKR